MELDDTDEILYIKPTDHIVSIKQILFELIDIGVKNEQVVKIAGMGDSVPMENDGNPIEPESKKNRRFEVLIRTKPETE